MISDREALDLSVKIETAENIAFEYRIAGVFRRLPALVVDLVIRIAIIVALRIAFLLRRYPQFRLLRAFA